METEAPTDYADTRLNGFWFTEGSHGYQEILDRGYPRPRYKATVLAEIHSPDTPDFMHGGDGNLPFLISARCRDVLRKHELTGFGFSHVEVAKIATKGARKRKSSSGEPDDQITKARDQSGSVPHPTLFAVRVTGRLQVAPVYGRGLIGEPELRIVSFRFPGKMPDLWRPTIGARPLWWDCYCSERFRNVVAEHGLTNIAFHSLAETLARTERGWRIEK